MFVFSLHVNFSSELSTKQNKLFFFKISEAAQHAKIFFIVVVLFFKIIVLHLKYLVLVFLNIFRIFFSFVFFEFIQILNSMNFKRLVKHKIIKINVSNFLNFFWKIEISYIIILHFAIEHNVIDTLRRADYSKVTCDNYEHEVIHSKCH